jgi:hypothetical protein
VGPFDDTIPSEDMNNSSYFKAKNISNFEILSESEKKQ